MRPVVGFIRPVTTNPQVTAGLKCPPEIAPSAATMTAMVSPCARPIDASVARPAGAPTIPAAEIERTPTKIRANVPIASATDCFSQFSDTILSLLVSGGLAGPVDNDRCTDELRRNIELVPVPEPRQVQLVVLPEVQVDLRPLIARLRGERDTGRCRWISTGWPAPGPTTLGTGERPANSADPRVTTVRPAARPASTLSRVIGPSPT